MKRSLQLFSIVTLVGIFGSATWAQDFSRLNYEALEVSGLVKIAPGSVVRPLLPPQVVANPDRQPPSLESTPIYRAQIKIRTADRDHASQEDGAKVRLNGECETWLDSGAGHFECGRTCTYDLLQVNSSGAAVLTKLSDIQMLEISKTGSDGWCFSDVELIINGRTIYKGNYPQGQWLDNSGGARLVHTISGATMRGGALWTSMSTSNR